LITKADGQLAFPSLTAQKTASFSLGFRPQSQNEGGNGWQGSQFAMNDPQGVGKGQSVRIEMLVLGGFVHQGAHSPVSEHHAVKLLLNQWKRDKPVEEGQVG